MITASKLFLNTDKRIIVFFVKFVLIYVSLYLFNYAIIGVTSPSGIYIEWIDKHFNYLIAFRGFLLNVSSHIMRLFGYIPTVINDGMYIAGGVGVTLALPCLGIGIIFFWWAFVLSFPQLTSHKIKYFAVGTFVFVSLNIIRICLLSAFLSHGYNKNINHHLIFNIITYIAMFILIFKWINLSTTDNLKHE